MSWKALNWSLTVEVETSMMRLVLMLLANRADETFSCYPSNRTLASEACAARSTVIATLGKLEKQGLIQRVAQYHDSGARRPNSFLLNHPDAPHRRASPDLGHPQSVDTTGAVRSPEGEGPPPGRQRVPGADPLNHPREPSSEPSTASVLKSLPEPWRVSGKDARKLSPAIELAFAAGWTSQTLVAHLSSRPEGVRYPAGVLARRLTELPAPPSISPRPGTPWCGECEDPLSRTITVTQADGTEAAAFCPRCSPQRRSKSTDMSTRVERR
ncbi:helix-turn-helix domain-containing protein [Mycobacterium hodleri]|uniref:Helix-turn-helix domain-containing protein n=1 Tax=Mycolicibacterium hodleri TaxID=49897 RepID=A0A544W5Z8_9MYCO|nr:helix-turn-helix domain-containing protein [Mycolicibacterium hodleri]